MLSHHFVYTIQSYESAFLSSSGMKSGLKNFYTRKRMDELPLYVFCIK